MKAPRSRAVLLGGAALVASLWLAGCGAKNGLDKDTAASLILNAEWRVAARAKARSCKVTTHCMLKRIGLMFLLDIIAGQAPEICHGMSCETILVL
jgi:hypothetical protein